MASYLWKGGVGSYLDATQWSPNAVPLYGADSSVVINGGVAILSNAQPNGVAISLGSAAGAELLLDNAALGASTYLAVQGKGTLGVRGYDSSYASFTLSAALLIDTSGNGQLNQYGTITVTAGGSLAVGPAGVLNNAGAIRFADGSGTIADSIIGTGTIELDTLASALSLTGTAGPGQVFVMHAGSLDLADPAGFRATLSGFDSREASLTIRNLAFDQAVTTGTALNLLQGGSVVGQIGLKATAAVAYTVRHNADGSATITPAADTGAQVLTDGSIPGVIDGGTVIIRNAAPNGRSVQFGSTDPTAQPILVLDNAALGAALQFDVAAAANPHVTAYGTIQVLGYDTTEATIALGGRFANPDVLGISLGAWGQLNQNGTIVAGLASSLTVRSMDAQAPGRVNNNGLIELTGGVMKVLADVTGGGEIRMTQAGGGSGGGFLELGGSVSADQRIRFDGGILQLDNPAAFHATLTNFLQAGPELQLRNTMADGAALRTTGAGTVLDVTLAGTVVQSFAVAGNLSRDGYQAIYDAATGISSVRASFT